MPFAPTSSVSISGERSARSAASCARLSPVAKPMPMSAEPAFGHDGAHVREVEVDEARHRDQVADALDALAQHVVGDPEGVEHRRRAVEHLEQAVVRDDDDGVADLAQRLGARLGLRTAARALEAEGHRDDADRERADVAGELGDDGRRARAGASAFAGGDEDHVGARAGRA